MTEQSASSPAPLSGVQVLEVANFLAAPTGTADMADLGGDVIKIEPPLGDTTRAMQMAGEITAINRGFHAPFSIHGADIQPRGGAPSLGAHTDEVLREAGFAAEEVADLAAAGISG